MSFKARDSLAKEEDVLDKKNCILKLRRIFRQVYTLLL